MPSALRFREDHSAEEVRALARRSKDVNQSRRLPSLAAVRDGMDRGSAAKIGGIDRQTLRSCVRMIPGEKLRQSIGYVIHGHGLFPHWTVARNIPIVPKLLNWDASRHPQATRGAIEASGLPRGKVEIPSRNCERVRNRSVLWTH